MADTTPITSEAPDSTTPNNPVIPAGSMPIYDMSGQQPVLNSIDPSEVTDAVSSGKWSLPTGAKVPVLDPQGNKYTIDPEEAAEAFKNGWKYQSPDALQQASYNAPTSTLGATIEGGLQGVLGPLATGLEVGAGKVLDIPELQGQAMRNRAAEHPLAHTLGEATGFLSSLLTGTGEAALVGDAGEAAAKAVGLGSTTTKYLADTPLEVPAVQSFIQKIGAGSVRGATEMALLQSGDEISKRIEGDPAASADTALAHVGLSSLLGAGVGGALGAVSPLFEKMAGTKLAQGVADFKGRMTDLLNNPNQLDSVTKEAQDVYSNVKSMADEVYGPQGLKAKDIASTMPQMSSNISDQVQETADDVQKQIKKMAADQYTYPPRFTIKAQADLENYMGKVTNPNATPADLFNATQDLKQQFQAYSSYAKRILPTDEAYQFTQDSKGIASGLRQSLEDSDVWGKAAQRQQAINKAFTEFNPALKDFEKKFTTEINGDRVIDPGKMSTYMNQLGKPSAELKQSMMENFLDAADKYRGVISNTHANLGLENPLPPTSTQALRGTLGEKTSGAKLAEFLVNKGINNLAGEGIGATIGGTLGHFTGFGEGFGALIGEKALSPFLKSVLPSLAKPLLKMNSSGVGLKAATDYGLNVAKGDSIMSKAAKNIFKTGEIVPQSVYPTSNDREKLDKKISDNNKITNLADAPTIGGHIAHYLPDHQIALAQTAVTATKFLSGIKPDTLPLSPLDSPRVPNSTEIDNYNRALDIAHAPMIVANKIREGSITPSDVVALKTMFPGIHQALSSKISQEMTSTLSKGDVIPYKTRMGISLFLGQPMDSTMTPSSIIAAQPQPVPQQQPPQTKKGTAKLGKNNDLYKTPLQASESDKATKA